MKKFFISLSVFVLGIILLLFWMGREVEKYSRLILKTPGVKEIDYIYEDDNSIYAGIRLIGGQSFSLYDPKDNSFTFGGKVIVHDINGAHIFCKKELSDDANIVDGLIDFVALSKKYVELQKIENFSSFVENYEKVSIFVVKNIKENEYSLFETLEGKFFCQIKRRTAS